MKKSFAPWFSFIEDRKRCGSFVQKICNSIETGVKHSPCIVLKSFGATTWLFNINKHLSRSWRKNNSIHLLIHLPLCLSSSARAFSILDLISMGTFSLVPNTLTWLFWYRLTSLVGRGGGSGVPLLCDKPLILAWASSDWSKWTGNMKKEPFTLTIYQSKDPPVGKHELNIWHDWFHLSVEWVPDRQHTADCMQWRKKWNGFSY